MWEYKNLSIWGDDEVSF